MTRATSTPCFTANTPGPWGVDTIGDNWCVVHQDTLRAKVIGPVGGRRTNYFDRAIEEADRRNRSGEPMKTRHAIVDAPAYRLSIDITQSNYGTTVELVSQWPTANKPVEHVTTRVTLDAEGVSRLYAALGQALAGASPPRADALVEAHV